MNFFVRKCFIAAMLVCVLALSNRLDAEQWQARHNMTPAQFQSTFDDLFKQGYRLKQISGYESGGSERYAGLWVKDGGPAFYARTGVSAADFQKYFDDYTKQGFRLTWVSAHNVGGNTRFEGIWEKNTGAAWQARHNMTAADYQKTFDDLTKQGYRLVHISGYETGGQERFAAIFDKSGGPAWQARHHMSAADYQKAFDDFVKQGYRLKEVSGYNVGGQDMYAAIWEKSGGVTWYSRNGIPDAGYQNVYDNFYYQGNQPVYISAFSSGGAGKLNVIWDNPNFSGADLQAISQKIQAYMSANQVPGVALAITKDGRLVYAAGFGYANKETGEEAAPDQYVAHCQRLKEHYFHGDHETGGEGKSAPYRQCFWSRKPAGRAISNSGRQQEDRADQGEAFAGTRFRPQQHEWRSHVHEYGDEPYAAHLMDAQRSRPQNDARRQHAV